MIIISEVSHMPNFTRFLSDPQFIPFAEAAVTAEKVYAIAPATCALNCRRAVEFAAKWMYSVDGCSGHAQRQPAGEPDGRRGLPGHRGGGPVAAAEVHPTDGQRRRPHGEEDHSGTGPAVPGKPLHLPGLCGLLLRNRLHRGAV